MNGTLSTTNALATACDSLVKGYYEKDLFWGNVLISSEGNVEFKKSYGFASYEWNVPHRHDTIFRIGCITKFITAIRIMQLCESEELTLTNTVKDFFPNLASTSIGNINIHQLLSHSSGLKDFFEVDEFPNKVFNKEEFEEMLKGATLGFEPGSQSEYANLTYTLLSYIIEDVTGTSFHSDIKNNLFDPLGMTRSTIEYGCNDLVLEKASGYMNTANTIRTARFFNVNVYKGCAACYSTVDDIHTLCLAFLNGKLMSQMSKEKMLLINDNHDPYGCSIRFKATQQDAKTLIIFKNGGVYGYRSTIALIPDSQKCLVILGNLEVARETFIKMIDELLTLVFSTH